MLFQYILGNLEIRHGIGFVGSISRSAHVDVYGAFASTPTIFLFALLAIVAVAYLILHVAENKVSGNDESIALFSIERDSKIDHYYKQYFSNSETPFYLVEAIWYELLAYLADYDHDRIGSGSYFLKNPDAEFDFASHKQYGLTFWRNLLAKLNVSMSILEEFNPNYTFKELVEYLKPKLKVPPRILVISNTNSSYSFFIKSLINYFGKDRFKAFSANNPSVEKIDPNALTILENKGLPIEDYKSQPLADFAEQWFDIVISFGDSATKEAALSFLNCSISIHWELPQLGQLRATETAPLTTYAALEERIQSFALMPIETMESDEISRALNRIGEIA